MKKLILTLILTFGVSALILAGPADDAYKNAKNLMAKGDLQSALKAANDGLAIDPAHFDLNSLAGNIYSVLGDYQNSLNSYKKALEKKGKDADALFGAGMAAYKLKSYDEAIQYFQQGEKTGKLKGQFFYGLGLAQTEKGDFANADLNIRKAIDKDKKNPLYHLALAETNYRNKVFSIAATEFKKAMEIDSTLDKTHQDIHYKLAQSQINLRNIPGAIDEYKIQVDHFPSDSTSWLELGRIYEISNIQAEAVFCYEKFLALSPLNGVAWFNLGKLYLATKNPDKAAAAFEKAVELKSHEAESFGNLAKIYADRKEYEKSIDAYNRYETAFGSPDSVDYWIEKGKVELKLGEKNANYFDSAFVAFNKSITIDSLYSSAYEYAGLTLYYKKDYVKAIPYFQKKVSLDTTGVNSYRNMAFCYLKTEQYGLAAGSFEKALAIKPEDVTMRAMTAKIYTFAGMYGKAIDHFEYILNHNTPELTDSLKCEIYPDLGSSYLNQKNCQTALTYLLKAEQCKPRDVSIITNIAVSYQMCNKVKDSNVYYKKCLAIDPNNKVCKRGDLETTIQK